MHLLQSKIPGGILGPREMGKTENYFQKNVFGDVTSNVILVIFHSLTWEWAGLKWYGM